MPRPNLLFLFTDQQRQDTLGAYGNEFIQTPNLDALAHESIVFENAYVTQPVCTPSRSSIMTGLYPHTSGCTENNIPLARQHQTIAEMLPDQYECGYFGKWHLGDEVIGQHGFEKHWVSTEEYHGHRTRPLYEPRHSSYYHFLKGHGLEPDRESEDGYRWFSRSFACHLPKELTKPAFTASRVNEFIRQNHDSPLVAYVNFLEPHQPFHGPFDKLHDPAKINTSEVFLREGGEGVPLRVRLLQKRLGQKPPQHYLDLKARYYGLVSLVDHYCGQILRTLEECGVADNTIVVFTSDHGEMMGDHALMYKTVMYEQAVQVPLLLRVPEWGNAGQRFDPRVSQVDLVPTLLDLMQVPGPSHLQGQSLRPRLEGAENSTACEEVFIEWNGSNGFQCIEGTRWSQEEQKRVGGARSRTVITPDGWKLTMRRDDLCELYDLREDPHETHNLYADEKASALVADLTEKIDCWQSETGDHAEVL